MSDIAYHCDQCEEIDACKFAFGKYWEAKSGSGEGCNHPFSPTQAQAIRFSRAFRHASAEIVEQTSFDSPAGAIGKRATIKRDPKPCGKLSILEIAQRMKRMSV